MVSILTLSNRSTGAPCPSVKVMDVSGVAVNVGASSVSVMLVTTCELDVNVLFDAEDKVTL